MLSNEEGKTVSQTSNGRLSELIKIIKEKFDINDEEISKIKNSEHYFYSDDYYFSFKDKPSEKNYWRNEGYDWLKFFAELDLYPAECKEIENYDFFEIKKRVPEKIEKIFEAANKSKILFWGSGGFLLNLKPENANTNIKEKLAEFIGNEENILILYLPKFYIIKEKNVEDEINDLLKEELSFLFYDFDKSYYDKIEEKEEKIKYLNSRTFKTNVFVIRLEGRIPLHFQFTANNEKQSEKKDIPNNDDAVSKSYEMENPYLHFQSAHNENENIRESHFASKIEIVKLIAVNHILMFKREWAHLENNLENFTPIQFEDFLKKYKSHISYSVLTGQNETASDEKQDKPNSKQI